MNSLDDYDCIHHMVEDGEDQFRHRETIWQDTNWLDYSADNISNQEGSCLWWNPQQPDQHQDWNDGCATFPIVEESHDRRGPDLFDFCHREEVVQHEDYQETFQCQEFQEMMQDDP